MSTTTLANFVTPQEVRAVLGVAPEELEDSTLAMPLYLRQLQFNLSDIDTALESTYLTIAALSSRTAKQQKLYDVMQTYTAYAISRFLLASVSLFAPKRITDGKAEMERVVDPFQDVREGVDAGYFVLLERLRNAYVDLGITLATASRSFTYTTSAPLTTNPITGT